VVSFLRTPSILGSLPPTFTLFYLNKLSHFTPFFFFFKILFRTGNLLGVCWYGHLKC
jgi:hypothetical protein